MYEKFALSLAFKMRFKATQLQLARQITVAVGQQTSRYFIGRSQIQQNGLM